MAAVCFIVSKCDQPRSTSTYRFPTYTLRILTWVGASLRQVLLRKEVGATNDRSFTPHWVFPGSQRRTTSSPAHLGDGRMGEFVNQRIVPTVCKATQSLNAKGKQKTDVVSGVSRCLMR